MAAAAGAAVAKDEGKKDKEVEVSADGTTLSSGVPVDVGDANIHTNPNALLDGTGMRDIMKRTAPAVIPKNWLL